MFGILEDITKAAVGIVKLPITVAADVLTLGGVVVDRNKSYTEEELETIARNLKNATKPND